MTLTNGLPSLIFRSFPVKGVVGITTSLRMGSWWMSPIMFGELYPRIGHVANPQSVTGHIISSMILIGIWKTICSYNWMYEWLSYNSFKHKKFVWVSSSAWTATTNYHRLGHPNNKYSSLTVLGVGSPRSGCQHCWVTGRAFFLAWRWPHSHCTLTWMRENTLLSLPLTIRAQDPS